MAEGCQFGGISTYMERIIGVYRQYQSTEVFGYSDGKLPTKKQLFSLVSHRQVNPALTKDHPFMNVFNGYYWTSTEVARYPLQAWYVHFGGGRVFKGMKHGS